MLCFFVHWHDCTRVQRVARGLCRYDFDAYSEASDTMYGIFLRYAPVVMAVSCDEAFLELPEGTNPMAAATQVTRDFHLRCY